MAPYATVPLSPAELSYLHTSLISNPPLRPDGRTPTTFRPLVAETDVLPTANGSARVCFADGTEAVVGVKGDVEKTPKTSSAMDGEEDGGVSVGLPPEEGDKKKGQGEDAWVEVSIEIPGMRDDDPLPVFLGAMIREPLLASGELGGKLWVNSRYHWRLYIDILLLSQTLSYPLPLLSLTTHLALLSTRLPALVSQGDEDPLFNDDWHASTPLYDATKPPVTLLVMSVGENILFDPSREELAVADGVVAVSVASATEGLRVAGVRMVDPPSRLTGAGVPNVSSNAGEVRERDQGASVWRPPRGGVGRGVLGRMVKMVVERGGVGEEVLGGLAGVET